MESLSVTIQMKATEQYFPVVLFVMLYKVVLTFESVDETLSSVIIPLKAIEQPFPKLLHWGGGGYFVVQEGPYF